MINKALKFRPIAEVFGIGSISFLLHQAILQVFYPKTEAFFHYSLLTIYGFFIFCSVLIVFILIKIKEKNINSLGNTFLLLTCIKMGLSYVLVLPLLKIYTEIGQLEKFNFFVVFALFLSIETIVTIRILNKKQ